MERKIGEIFEYNNEWYQCIDELSCGVHCNGCDFLGRICSKLNPKCSPTHNRSDGKFVIFKKLEKVGNSYIYNTNGNKGVVKMQDYKLYDTNFCKECDSLMLISSYNPMRIAIEIKQSMEEDMKEKKPTYEELLHYYHSTVGLWAIDRSPQEVSLDWICDNAFQLGIDEKDSNSENIGKNLREFDLEAAKQGKPVCTRDGRKARIICFDKKCLDEQILIVLVDCGKEECMYFYTTDGKCIDDFSSFDLMMLPEKKEGWVNIYKGSVCISVYPRIYKSREEAVSDNTAVNRIDTVKIFWEE